MKVVNCVVGSLLTLAAVPANASDWRLTGTSTHGDKQYVDASTVVMGATTRKAWVREDLPEVSAQGLNRTKSRREFDCSERRYRVLSMTAFKDADVVATLNEATDWSDISPDSMDEAVLKTVCSL